MDGARRTLATWPPELNDGGAVQACTTALLRGQGEGLEVLLIERSRREGDPWSGHIALPGGRTDPADPSASATALRELVEEVGVAPSDLEAPLRYVGRYRGFSQRFDVALFAAMHRGGAAAPRAADPNEVAAVFWFPLAELRRPVRLERATARGPIEVEAVPFHERVLWGLTYRMLTDLVDRLARDPKGTGRA